MSLRSEVHLQDLSGQTIRVTLMGADQGVAERAEVSPEGQRPLSYDLRRDGADLLLQPGWTGPFDDKSAQLATLRLIEVLFGSDQELATIKVAAPLAQSWERKAFYMDNPELWTRRTPSDESWTETGSVRHPVRPVPAFGKLYQRWIPQLGKTLSFELLDLEKHLEVFHEWQNQKRVSVFWELDKPIDELRSYLEKVHSDPHHLPVIGCIDDVPVGYFEVYWTPEDRLGPYYEPEPYDRGFHMLIGNQDFLGGPYTFEFLRALGHWLFLDEPRTQRLMAEPRSDNAKMLRYVDAFPVWKNLKTFDFPHKRACLLEFAKDRFLKGSYL